MNDRTQKDDAVEWLLASAPEALPALLRELSSEELLACVGEATSAAISRTGRGLNLMGANLSSADLSQLDLRFANLTRARLDSATLIGADLTSTIMICPMMERTTMRDAVLKEAYSHAQAAVSSDWSGVQMPGAIDTTGSLFHGVTLVRSNLSGGNYAGTTFYQCDLTEADLRNCDFTGSVFNECILRNADFRGSELSSATMTRSHADGMNLADAKGAGLVLQQMTSMRSASLTAAHLPELSVRGAHWDVCTATGASLQGMRMSHVTMTACDLSGADLSDCTWISVSGERANLRRAQLAGAVWTRCRLPGTDLRGGSMENARLLECNLPDSRFTSIEDDQGYASFTARGLTVRDCGMPNADFTGAYLYRASFTGDPVTGMRLDDAKFTAANLIQAYIAAAMPGATLRRVLGAYSRFNQSDLTGADLTGASLYQASFIKVVLPMLNLTAVSAPVFFDRCKGMTDAVMDDDLRDWAGRLAATLATRRSGST